MGEERFPNWRPKAWDDIEGHAIFVGDAGQKFLDRVEYTVQLLCNHPKLGGAFETTNPRLVGIRAKLVADFPRYVVFYRSRVGEVDIVRVLGGGQDMHSLIDTET